MEFVVLERTSVLKGDVFFLSVVICKTVEPEQISRAKIRPFDSLDYYETCHGT
jgi:hypothetical protein